MRLPIALMLCVLLPLPVMAADPPKTALDTARSRVYPALVNINVVYRYFRDGRAQRSLAGGSGVIISPDGYVLTNYHVAGHSTHLSCTLSDGETLDAQDIADDPLSDLSVLRLRLDSPQRRNKPLPWAKLGDSDTLSVGDSVLAMGNPLMLSSSMTLGIVSNARRVFTDFSGTEIEDVELDEGEKTGTFTRWIQHDALILPGNSGGPLVNLQGEVVGINELGNDGVGFAIPSNLARSVFEDILHYGQVRRGWLGLGVMPVEKLGRTTGALISSVTPASPTARAGVLPGDLLLTLNDKPVTVRFFEEVPVFYQRVARLGIGSIAKLRLVRDGKPLSVSVPVAPLAPSLGAEQEFPVMGVTARALTPMMALDRYLPDTHGVLVTGVRPGLPFETAQPPISEDDIITAVDGQPTPDLAAFGEALQSCVKRRGGSSGFPVTLRRKDESLLAIVKTNIDKTPDDGGELPLAWVGIKTQVLIPEVANAIGMPGQTGFRISEVYPFTEAGKAGLMPGDVITSLNGTALEASQPQDSEDLTHQIEALTVGDHATFGIRRGSKELTVPIVLEQSPATASEAKTSRSKELEFTVRNITLMDKADNHWPEAQQGVLVTEVTSGGWASIAGLQVDDLILSLNGNKVTDSDSFEKLLPALIRTRPKVLTVFVRRDALTHFVFLEPDWSHSSSNP